jgi:DNA-binding CsgD family transcriptional regulator
MIEAELKLSPRQREVLILICEHGATDGEIAEALDLAIGTAKTHVRLVLKAAGARSKVDLVRWFYTQRTQSNDSVTKTAGRASRGRKPCHTRRK